MNALLACIAAVVWSASYAIFFQNELVRWWRLRHVRRAQTEAERARAIADYAAWVRNIPPPRSRVPVLPDPAPPIAKPQPQRGGEVVPFPRGGRAALR